jgi:hypothetical protein
MTIERGYYGTYADDYKSDCRGGRRRGQDFSGNNDHAKRDVADSRAPFLADLLVASLYIQAGFSLAFTRLLRREYC